MNLMKGNMAIVKVLKLTKHIKMLFIATSKQISNSVVVENKKTKFIMENKDTQNWPDLAIGLYDKLTGRNATITYEFEEMEVDVPSSTNSSDSAKWKLNGTLRITTSEDGNTTKSKKKS